MQRTRSDLQKYYHLILLEERTVYNGERRSILDFWAETGLHTTFLKIQHSVLNIAIIPSAHMWVQGHIFFLQLSLFFRVLEEEEEEAWGGGEKEVGEEEKKAEALNL